MLSREELNEYQEEVPLETMCNKGRGREAYNVAEHYLKDKWTVEKQNWEHLILRLVNILERRMWKQLDWSTNVNSLIKDIQHYLEHNQSTDVNVFVGNVNINNLDCESSDINEYNNYRTNESASYTDHIKTN